MVSSGYSSTMTLELVKLLKKFNINIDFFNLCIVKPLNTDEILNSVKNTGKIIIIDSGHKILGIGSEIMSRILEKNIKFKNKPLRIGLPDNPTPSSRAFVKNIYINRLNLFRKICDQIKINKLIQKKIVNIIKVEDSKIPVDIPNPKFKGPF